MSQGYYRFEKSVCYNRDNSNSDRFAIDILSLWNGDKTAGIHDYEPEQVPK